MLADSSRTQPFELREIALVPRWGRRRFDRGLVATKRATRIGVSHDGMALQLGPRRVMAPDGVEWHVGRRWLTRRPKPNRPHRRAITSESVSNLGSGWPDIGNLDLGEGLLVAAAAVAVVLILIPVLFFGSS